MFESLSQWAEGEDVWLKFVLVLRTSGEKNEAFGPAANLGLLFFFLGF